MERKEIQDIELPPDILQFPLSSRATHHHLVALRCQMYASLTRFSPVVANVRGDLSILATRS